MEHDYLVLINVGLTSHKEVNVFCESEIDAIIAALNIINNMNPRPHVYNIEVLT
nr:MAG: hypothetical protein [Bacteriophage sp.]